MQPDRIQIAVRSRRTWEAIDLGFRMVRVWWRPLYGAWVALVIPFWALWIGATWSRPELMLFGIWWLKPVCERVPLHVLSEALFRAPPRVRDTILAAPRWLRGGTLLSLTWLRSHPARSMVLPILQLEELRGARRALRTRVIVGPDQGAAMLLLLVCGAFQLVPFALGAAGLAQLFFPKYISPMIALTPLIEDLSPELVLRTLSLAYAVTLTCVEPLYVAAGFALYINRRIYLEGWDIDLVFRKLVERVKRPTAGSRRAPLLRRSATRALCAATLLLVPAISGAQEQEGLSPCPIDRPGDARQCIERVLEGPDFHFREKLESWELREWTDTEENDEAESAEEEGFGFMVSLVRALILIACAVALLRLLVYAVDLRRSETRRGGRAAREIDPEVELVRRTARQEGSVLAADPIGVARAHFAQGDASGALSLLYRAALDHMTHRGIDVPASATEWECARVVRGAAPGGLSRDFDVLVEAWELCAYASRAPQASAFDALCARWERHLLVAPAP